MTPDISQIGRKLCEWTGPLAQICRVSKSHFEQKQNVTPKRSHVFLNFDSFRCDRVDKVAVVFDKEQWRLVVLNQLN